MVATFLLLISCQTDQDDLEAEVINDILKDFLPEYAEFSPSATGSQYRTLLISDSLISPSLNATLISLRKKSSDQEPNFHHDDNPAWSLLYSEFISSTLAARPLDFTSIRQVSSYEINPSSAYKQFDKKNLMGVVAFSRIIFDKRGTKACLYYSFICGGECGEGRILFLEKEHGHWQQVFATNLWIT